MWFEDGAEIRKKKKTEAFNAGSDERGSGRMDFTAKQLPSYLKVTCAPLSFFSKFIKSKFN